MTSLFLGFMILNLAPLDASKVLSNAAAQARKEQKNIFAYFGASWCSWCRRTDALLANPQFESKFKDSYVIAKITIRERDEKRALENAGWEDILLKIRGSKDRDVPYFAVLDSKGKKLGDGLRYQEGKIPNNGGFPHTGEEADAFVELIRKTGKAFSEKDLTHLRAYFLLQ
ncbi:MAG: thioredoxin family protein [Chlorobia bacterium]|nr:thioredoxin family protein [Fimbriimonadaceae bacterium]